MTDDQPISETYKGVGIHAGQTRQRVATVKRELDRVTRVRDLTKLYAIARDCSWSPEARFCAGVRTIAGLQLATERRQPRPNIDVADVEAAIAGLNSAGWRDPLHYCSLFDADCERAALREQPLPPA